MDHRINIGEIATSTKRMERFMYHEKRENRPIEVKSVANGESEKIIVATTFDF